jgi:hypothetical protein
MCFWHPSSSRRTGRTHAVAVGGTAQCSPKGKKFKLAQISWAPESCKLRGDLRPLARPLKRALPEAATCCSTVLVAVEGKTSAAQACSASAAGKIRSEKVSPWRPAAIFFPPPRKPFARRCRIYFARLPPSPSSSSFHLHLPSILSFFSGKAFAHQSKCLRSLKKSWACR